jgi:hypothetical protein
MAYQPSAELWSDGMEKRRWIQLPPATQIDTTNPDAWVFPVGTKFWKEFAYAGRRIETRFMEKEEDHWRRTTFRWNSDESNALELVSGERNVPGTRLNSYEVLPTTDCGFCHRNATDNVLGFSGISLSDGARGLDAETLMQRQLVTTSLPRVVVPGYPIERSALAYLHINCGVSCHNPDLSAAARLTGFYLRLQRADLASVQQTAAYLTGVARESYIPSSRDPQRYLDLIAPGQPDESALAYRASQRGNGFQMPPLATHVIDDDGLALLRAFITQLK